MFCSVFPRIYEDKAYSLSATQRFCACSVQILYGIMHPLGAFLSYLHTLRLKGVSH